MPDAAIDARVRSVVSAVFSIPAKSVTMSTSNKNVKNWDSLNIINLMIALESEFGITIEVDEAANLLSVEKIMEILRLKGIF